MKVLLFNYSNFLDNVVFVNSEEDFFENILQKKYDVVIINFDFFNSFLEIKKYINSVIVFLSSSCSELIYKKALNYGDYCYTYDEIFKLKIRLEYINRKILKLKGEIFRYKDLVFNLKTNQLYKNKKPIKLTKAEREILTTLIKNRNRYVKKDELVNNNIIESYNSIKVLISNLRKLGFDIENLKNVGYKLKELR